MDDPIPPFGRFRPGTIERLMGSRGADDYWPREETGGMREPTAEQCTAREKVDLGDGRVGYACWYPQMGGYCGRALVVPSAGCIEVYVWHDGEFPFGDDDPDGGPAGPRRLHHCEGAQFMEFGEFLQRVQEGDLAA